MVVDSNNQARTLNDDEAIQGQRDYGVEQSKPYRNHDDHNHNPAHYHDANHVHSHSNKLSNREYEDALYEVLKVRPPSH